MQIFRCALATSKSFWATTGISLIYSAIFPILESEMVQAEAEGFPNLSNKGAYLGRFSKYLKNFENALQYWYVSLLRIENPKTAAPMN